MTTPSPSDRGRGRAGSLLLLAFLVGGAAAGCADDRDAGGMGDAATATQADDWETNQSSGPSPTRDSVPAGGAGGVGAGDAIGTGAGR